MRKVTRGRWKVLAHTAKSVSARVASLRRKFFRLSPDSQRRRVLAEMERQVARDAARQEPA